MTAPGDSGTAGAYLVGSMWWYAAYVLRPAQALKRAGLSPIPTTGDLPHEPPRPGLGPHFSRRHREPVLLSKKTRHDDLVEEFPDRMSEVYAEFVQPFSQPLFDEALTVMRDYLPGDARVLDAGCGPGGSSCGSRAWCRTARWSGSTWRPAWSKRRIAPLALPD